MNTTIKNFLKVLLIAITIFSMSIISSCSKDCVNGTNGLDGATGKAGINGTNGINASTANSGFEVMANGGYASGQSIPNITETKVLFDYEATDDLNAFNTSNSQLTIPVDGFYHLSTTVKFYTTLPNETPVILEMRKNGSPFKSFVQRLGVVPSININGNFKLQANDVITVYIYHNSGSSKNLDGSGVNTNFSGYRVY